MTDHVRKSSIVDGELVRTSVSQLKTFDTSKHGGCNRRWWWQKKAGIEEEPGSGAKESTKCHVMAEEYLRTGLEPLGSNKFERAFLAGKWMLPKREDIIGVEMPFDGEVSLAGVPFNGKIDVVFFVDNDMGICVGDHKFHGDISRALSKEQLEHDPQMLGYAMVMLTKRPLEPGIWLVHFNYQKSEPRVEGGRRVRVWLSADTVHERWTKLESVVIGMKNTAKHPMAETVPGNLNACYAWGKKNPCPHLYRCSKMEVKSLVLSAEEEAMFGGPTVVPQTSEDHSPFCEGSIGLKCDIPAMCMPQTFTVTLPGTLTSITPVAVLPPDAPASNPTLAAAHEGCETEKNFQHASEDCPKLAKPEKRKRAKPQAAAAERPIETTLPPITSDISDVPLIPPEVMHILENRIRDELAKEFILAAIKSGVSPTECVDSCFTAADLFMARCTR